MNDINNSNKKRILVFSIVIVIIIVFATFLGAYAYYTSAGGNNARVNLSIDSEDGNGDLEFSLIGSGNLSFTLDPEYLMAATASDEYTSYMDGETANATFTISGIDPLIYDEGIKCGYEIYYESIVSYTKSSYASNNNLKELAIHGEAGDKNFDISIDNVSTRKLLYSGEVTSLPLDTSISETWSFNYRFYNLNGDQSTSLDKTVSGNVVVKTTTCSKVSTLGNHIKSIAYEVDETINESNAVVHETFTQGSDTIDAGYRYEGPNPDNYICVLTRDKDTCLGDQENYLYRIIGLFNDGLDADNNLIENIKVIHYYGDTSSTMSTILKKTNYWPNTSAYSVLNVAANILDEPSNINTRYYFGAPTELLTASEAYVAERTVTPTAKATGWTLTWDGVVGLMYPSDYGYAVLEKNCIRSNGVSSYVNEDCHEKNWLWYSSKDQWTMGVHRTTNTMNYMISSSGGMEGKTTYLTSGLLRKVFSIRSDIKYNGTGTITDPFIISD